MKIPAPVVRVGMVSRFPPAQDGIAIYTETLCRHLQGQGVAVARLGPQGSREIPLDTVRLKEELAGVVADEKLDVLHFQYIAPYFGRTTLNLGLLRALELPIPTVVTLHEVQQEIRRGAKDRVLRALERRLVARASAVVTHTRRQAAFVRDRYGKPASCIYMGVEPRGEGRRSPTLLFFGFVSPAKGLDVLLEAMDLLPQLRLSVAGRLADGVPRRYLEEIRTLAERDNVEAEFAWIDDERKDELFRSSAVLVLPYRWAPYQSAVLHDAVAYGLPVVATSAGSIDEVVTDFAMGVVAEPDDPRDLARAIRACLADYEKYARGIEDYRRAASWEKTAGDTARLYRDLVPARGRPG